MICFLRYAQAMSINRIAFYHLETLLWIARLGTFAAAAERLNTTQPAISARVRELENHLGTVLFRREGRTMTLTPAGRELVRESEPLWRSEEHTSELQSLIRISYAVFCLKKKKTHRKHTTYKNIYKNSI